MQYPHSGTLFVWTYQHVRVLASFAVLLAAIAGQRSANATEYIYTPANGANDVWSDGTNWNTSPVSDSTTTLTFVGNNATILANGLTNTSVNVLAPFSVNTLNLQGTGPASGPATININSVATSGGYLRASNYSTVNLNALAGTAGLTYNVGSNLNLATTTFFQGNGTATFNFNGTISGSGGIYKSGSSALTLSGANTYTGDTFTGGGTLLLANANALQNSTLDYNGGGLSFGTLTNATIGSLKGTYEYANLVITNANNQPVALSVGGNNQSTTFAGAVRGIGSLSKTGSGTLTLSNYNLYTGDTNLMDGTLELMNDSSALKSTVNMGGGSLTFRTTTLPILGGLKGSGPITLQNAASSSVRIYVGYNDQSTEYGGVLSGSGSLTKIGSGTLVLSGTNTFSGRTNVASGKLTLTNSNALQNSTVGGVMMTLIYLSVPGEMSMGYTGGQVSFSTLTTATFGGLDGSLALSLTNTNNQPVALSVGNNNQSTAYSGTITGSGSLNKIGTGTLTLTKQCSYAGPTAISEGTLALGTNNTLPTNSALFLDGGTLATNGYGQTLGGLTVADDSSIDFGNGTSWLLLADSHLATWSGDLTILNWSGSESGLGIDKLKFSTSTAGLTTDQLSHIFFVDPYGLTGTFGAKMLSTGEVVAALPEPASWVMLATVAVILGVVIHRRRYLCIRAR